MSKINDLIKEMCPNGVKFDKLENIILLQAGDRITMMSDDYDFDVIGGGTLPTGKYNNYNREHCVTISRAGSAGFVNWKENKFWATDVCFTASKNNDYMDIKFVYYYLKNAQKDLQQHLYGGSMPKLEKNYLWKYPIPIPPLEVQNEIVRILDKFGELEAELETELETELEARKSQYEFWCGKLLDNDYETEALDSLCIKTNNINWKNDFETYKYIDLSSVNRDNNTIEETIDIDSTNAPSRARQIVKCNDILFGTTRPMLKRITIVPKEYDNQICSTGYCVLRPDQNKILPEWMYFNLQTEKFYKYVESFQQGASYPSISDSAVKNYEISIPPLEEQKRVVKILDKFDKLVNDITVGLPAEIELRRQQYEYYRNKLLSFEDIDNE